MISFEVRTDDTLTTVMYRKPFFTDYLFATPRTRRRIAALALKPRKHKHQTQASDRVTKEPYLLKRTVGADWLRLTVRFTRRYPISQERRSQWASQAHLNDSRRLVHG